MRLPFIASLAALGLFACEQPDTTVDEQVSAAAATNADASADAAAAAADASNVTSVDGSVGP